MNASERTASHSGGTRSPGDQPGQRRVAVIDGASGYIGSNLARLLLDEGQEVVALSRRGREETRRVIDEAVVARGHRMPRDARLAVVDYDLLAPGLGLSGDAGQTVFGQPCDYWHLAADVNFRPTFRDRIMAVNVEGTANTLAAFRALAPPGSTYVFVSSAYSCGYETEQPAERWYDDADDSSFRNFYEASKRRAELLVRNAIDAGISGVVLRLGQVVGDSETGRSTSDYGIYNLMRAVWTVARRRPGEHIRIEAHPASSLHLLPIDACVQWMRAVAQNNVGALSPPVVHVVDREPVRVGTLVEAIERSVPLRISVVTPDDFARTPSTRLERVVAARMAYMGAYLDAPFIFGRGNLDRLTEGEPRALDDEALDRVVSSFLLALREEFPPGRAADSSAQANGAS